MAVQEIESYRMKNGVDILKVILKPTKVFPEGNNYFYCPAEAIDLVQGRSWCLNKQGNGAMVISRNLSITYYFHQELCQFYLGHYVDYLDHINHIDIDNTDDNLNVVTQQQNQLNHFTRGYHFGVGKDSKLAFRPQIVLNTQAYYPFRQTHREDEACLKQCYAEQVILKEMMGDDYYQFDFLKYRRGELNLLDMERKGVISEEEAIYKHIQGYSDNAWYYLRYGLQDYFKQYNIPIPKYTLDEQGFMVHPITGQRLCPF